MCWVTTVFVDTRLWKTKHSWKRFQNFRQSCVLLTDRIEIHQSQPLAWPSNLLYVMLAGFDWWISIRHVDNTKDWRKFWKCFRDCFVFQSRVSTKTVEKSLHSAICSLQSGNVECRKFINTISPLTVHWVYLPSTSTLYFLLQNLAFEAIHLSSFHLVGISNIHVLCMRYVYVVIFGPYTLM